MPSSAPIVAIPSSFLIPLRRRTACKLSRQSPFWYSLCLLGSLQDGWADG